MNSDLFEIRVKVFFDLPEFKPEVIETEINNFFEQHSDAVYEDLKFNRSSKKIFLVYRKRKQGVEHE